MHSSIILLGVLSLCGANYQNSFQMFAKFYSPCANKTEILKCLKVQSLKIMDRALHSKAINVIDGVTLIGERQSRELLPLNGTSLEVLPVEEIDTMLEVTASKFFDSHRFEVNVPKLVEEGRKKSKGGGWGALLWALAIKGSFLALAYQGIAVMSGTAIIVGKMALVLSAILGLKKLVSSNHEKTTFEIVKVPKHSESHTHSTSYEDDDHHYHRSFDAFGRKISLKL